MLFRAGAEALLVQLHDELARKTLAIWNAYGTGRAYDHYVPWMSCLPPATGSRAVDHPVLSETYEAGSLLTAPAALSRLNEYLQWPQAAQLREDLVKDYPGVLDSSVAVDAVAPGSAEDYLFARETMEKAHPLLGALYRRLVHTVIPYAKPEVRRNTSLDRARGAIFMSFTASMDRWALGLELAHELGHQALMLINSADRLFVSDPQKLVFSGVRLTERPALQSLHAAAALTFMTLYTSGHSDPMSRVTVNTLTEQLGRTVSSVRERCLMTEIGHAVLADFQQVCDGSVTV